MGALQAPLERGVCKCPFLMGRLQAPLEGFQGAPCKAHIFTNIEGVWSGFLENAKFSQYIEVKSYFGIRFNNNDIWIEFKPNLNCKILTVMEFFFY